MQDDKHHLASDDARFIYKVFIEILSFKCLFSACCSFPDSWLWWLPQDTDSSNTILKRTGPSLSIVNPLDVLRQRLQLETARRRQYENEQRIRENELLLRNLGKRRTWHPFLDGTPDEDWKRIATQREIEDMGGKSSYLDARFYNHKTCPSFTNGSKTKK